MIDYAIKLNGGTDATRDKGHALLAKLLISTNNCRHSPCQVRRKYHSKELPNTGGGRLSAIQNGTAGEQEYLDAMSIEAKIKAKHKLLEEIGETTFERLTGKIRHVRKALYGIKGLCSLTLSHLFPSHYYL